MSATPVSPLADSVGADVVVPVPSPVVVPGGGIGLVPGSVSVMPGAALVELASELAVSPSLFAGSHANVSPAAAKVKEHTRECSRT